MFQWLRELLEIRYEYREKNTRLRSEVKHEQVVCENCEVLKEILAAERYDKQQLLKKLLAEPAKEVESVEPIEITRPKIMPWRVKRQLLEAEDRKKAELLRNAPKPDVDVKDLEKELDIVEKERESALGRGDAQIQTR